MCDVTSFADVCCTELDIFGEDGKIHVKFSLWAPSRILSTSRQYGIIMIRSNIIKETV